MKNYTAWHSKKTTLNEAQSRPFFHEREIWFVHVGANIGYEQDGVGDDYLRPVVIIRKFNNEIFWAVPLTRTKKLSPFYFNFSLGKEEKESSAILSQIRLVDAKRLSHKIGTLKTNEFIQLKAKLKALLP